MEIVRQLGDLLLSAVPTIIIVFLFYLFLRASFFRPIQRVMDERFARTAGARKAAEAAQRAAQEKNQAYQEAMKKARAAIYAEQELTRRGVLEERAQEIRKARTQANEETGEAKRKLAAELVDARKQLEPVESELAGEICRAILEQRPPQTRPTSEAR